MFSHTLSERKAPEESKVPASSSASSRHHSGRLSLSSSRLPLPDRGLLYPRSSSRASNGTRRRWSGCSRHTVGRGPSGRRKKEHVYNSNGCDCVGHDTEAMEDMVNLLFGLGGRGGEERERERDATNTDTLWVSATFLVSPCWSRQKAVQT